MTSRTFNAGDNPVHDWETPPEIFDPLDQEFGFTLDVCATEQTAKCARYFTEADDALTQDWTGVCWMNPPYGTDVGRWVAKACSSAEAGATVVGLLYARTDTRWFHEYVYHKAEIRFVQGRVSFLKNGQRVGTSPAPSIVVIWYPRQTVLKWRARMGLW